MGGSDGFGGCDGSGAQRGGGRCMMTSHPSDVDGRGDHGPHDVHRRREGEVARLDR